MSSAMLSFPISTDPTHPRIEDLNPHSPIQQPTHQSIHFIHTFHPYISSIHFIHTFHPFIHPSVRPPAHPPIRSSVRPSIRPSVRPSIHPFVDVLLRDS